MSGLQVSFEFFPPKTPEMEENLWRAIKRLEPLAPRFVSVTYGAGGSTRERTHRTVKRILAETPLVPAAHLTCVAAARTEVDQVARDYWNAGVRHIVALRGDPPAGSAAYEPPADGYRYAADLVTGLKAVGDFEVTVACFPEGHPESTSPHLDLDHLKRKIDAGATRAITQFFFDNDHYFRFLDKVRRRGIECEIVPGIMPVTNFRQMVGFAEKAGASVPRWLGQRFDGLDDDAETRRLVAATTVAEQVQGLAEQGVREFHFYTLNRADLSFAICHILGIRAKKAAAAEVTP
jgi:methylenetetrahydrofolate reductase (NADPH)